MTERTPGADRPPARAASLLAGPALILAAAVLAVVAAWQIPVTIGPDASMYGSIATSLTHGRGLVFPDGEAVTARPPLFAAATALFSGVAGILPAEAALSRLGFGAMLLLATALAFRIRGALAAALVLIALGVSPMFVRWTAATLIDGVAAALALTAALVLTTGRDERRRWLTAGLLLGASFLVKETAVFLLLVPIGLAIVDPGPPRTRFDHAAVAVAAFGLIAAPWFVWVAIQTGETYLLGADAAVGAIALLAVVALAAVLRGRLRTEAGDDAASDGRIVPWLVLAVLATVWVVGGWIALERSAGDGVTGNVLRSLYRYTRLTLAPDLPLLLAILVAAPVGLVLAIRTMELRPVALTAIGAAPVLPFVALRGFEARSLAVGIAAAAVLAAVAITWACARITARDPRWTRVLGGALVLAVAGLSVGPTSAAIRRQPALSARATWDRPEVASTAAWLASRVPPGASIVSSWQYAAMLYIQAGAAFQIRQVPLVRVVATGDAAAPLETLATLDTWQDRSLPRAPVGPVVYVANGVPADWVTLERTRFAELLDETSAPYLVVVGSGPPQRSGENYPFVGAAIGSPDAVFDQEQPGGTWIRVFAVPPSPNYDAGLVSLDPAAAIGVVLREPAAASATLDALGARSLRIWPANVPGAVVDALRQTGRPVVVASE